VADYSRKEAAKRAGLSVDELSRMVELGVLRPAEGDRFTPGDVRKAGLVQSVVQSGLPLEGIAQVVASGMFPLDFMDSPAYERFSALSDVTFAQLSQRTGIPLDLLIQVRESTGGALPSPDDRLREGELDVIPMLKLLVSEGFRLPAIERLMRVQGESLRRIAETEADFWRSEVIMPALAAGLVGEELTQTKLTERISPLIEPTMMANYRAHQAREWTRNVIEGLETLMAQAGIYGRVERPPAMCFLDITGYTRLTGERGDQVAAELAEQLGRMVQRTSVQHGGRPVKWLGDGVMFYFRDPGPGVIAALDMAEGVVAAGLPPAHVGLHAGPVVFQEGDYYGQTVNIASRIAEYARPGEVLVSQAVVEAAEDVGAAFTEIGPVELRGVGGTVQLHAARRE
jgi:adenylate cyclase